jgi:hypothetical protein
VWKLIIIHADKAKHYMFETSLTLLTLFASLAIFFILLTIANAVYCIRHSGHGLKNYIAGLKEDQSNSTDDRDFSMGVRAGDQNLMRYNGAPSRLSLD